MHAARTTIPPLKVLIIGGGFAGLKCATKLAGDARFEVILVDRTNHHLFQPLLYQVATASLSATDIARSIRQILHDAENVTVLMDEVNSIDLATKSVFCETGETLGYDYLVLAAGAKTGYFGNDDWEAHTHGLKTLADAQDVRRKVLSNLEYAELTENPAERRKLMTVAIVGGGPTGVELAGAFADLIIGSMQSDFRRIDTSTLKVILIEAGPRLLDPYDEDQSAYAAERLKSLGVIVRTGLRVKSISDQHLVFANGETLEAGAILWAAGVTASPLAQQLGVELDRGGRVRPELDLSLPGDRNVFVIGDMAAVTDRKGVKVPGVAPAAAQMGAHVAKVIKEDARLLKTRFAEQRETLRPQFEYWDKGMLAIIGKNFAVMKAGRLKLLGFPAWCAWLFVHILFLVGFRNKLSVLLGWGYAYLRNNPEARVIVHTPSEWKVPAERENPTLVSAERTKPPVSEAS